MVRNSAGAGLRKKLCAGLYRKTHTMYRDCRKQKLNYILGDLKKHLGPKGGHVRGKKRCTVTILSLLFNVCNTYM